jgi:Uma2 family endonuclease
MTGVTVAHAQLVVNLGYRLYDRVIGSGCRLFTESIKVRVEAIDAVYYPDLVVTCEPLQQNDRIITTPRLVLEVLSPSTKKTDLREKLVGYRTLPSLVEYVIVHQDRALVETYRKIGNEWTLLTFKGSDSVSFSSIPGGSFEIPIAQVYSQLEFPA